VRIKGGVERRLTEAERLELIAERESARRAAESFAGPANKKAKKAKTVGDAAFMKTLAAVSEMLRDGRWQDAEGKHFVGLYADLYFRVYGILPGDLGPKERVFASKLAGQMLAKQFDGDPGSMAKFMSWAWTREKEREGWRRSNGKDGSRIDWRFQFSAKLVQDYRIAEARKKSSG
jgi:hypothetical protein